jgi:hypothetical protein
MTIAGLAALVAGCGGGGGTDVQLSQANVTFTPDPGFTGDPSPLRSSAVSVTETPTGLLVTVAAGPRRLTLALPSKTLVPGQTFLVGDGTELEYSEGATAASTRHHGGIHWLGSKGTVGVKAPTLGQEKFVNLNLGGTAVSAGGGNSTGTGGSISIEVEVVPVSPGGSVKATGTGTSATLGWIVGTSATTELEPGNFVSTLTTTDGRKLEVFFTSASTSFTPGAIQIEGVRLTEGAQVWNGTAGQVVVGTTSHSLNTVTMSPDTATPATGSFTLGGVVVR